MFSVTNQKIFEIEDVMRLDLHDNNLAQMNTLGEESFAFDKVSDY